MGLHLCRAMAVGKGPVAMLHDPLTQLGRGIVSEVRVGSWKHARIISVRCVHQHALLILCS